MPQAAAARCFRLADVRAGLHSTRCVLQQPARSAPREAYLSARCELLAAIELAVMSEHRALLRPTGLRQWHGRALGQKTLQVRVSSRAATAGSRLQRTVTAARKPTGAQAPTCHHRCSR